MNVYILDGGTKGMMVAVAEDEIDARLTMMANMKNLYEKISEEKMTEEKIEYGVVYYSYGDKGEWIFISFANME